MIKILQKRVFSKQYVFGSDLLMRISQNYSSSIANGIKCISRLESRSLLVMHGPKTYELLKQLSDSGIDTLSTKAQSQQSLQVAKNRASLHTYFFSVQGKLIADAFVYKPKMYLNGKRKVKQDQLWIDVHSQVKNDLLLYLKEQSKKKQVQLTEFNSKYHSQKPIIYAGYPINNKVFDTQSHLQPGFQIDVPNHNVQTGSYAEFITIDPRANDYGLRILSMSEELNCPFKNLQLKPQNEYENFQRTTKQSAMKQIPIIPLKNDKVSLIPLVESDFERLFKSASDPLVWEQHPNPNRYKREVFRNYFNGAILSKGAFLISNTVTGEVIGSSRFYDYDFQTRVVKIGYTFLSRDCWGTKLNHEVKALMLNYAWNFVDKVHFEVGGNNIRSQIAIQRIGAKKIDEKEIGYFGQPSQVNFVYEIKK